ncbi:MAG: hypothetical protein IBJ13_00705 [Sphingopyxis sp.]|nr:hypothetical protein [Sphingopyxis sp.]
MTVSGSPDTRLMRWRYAIWLAAATLFLLNFLRRGIDAFDIVLTAIVVAFGFAIEHVETRTQRPRKTFLRGALFSLALAIVFVGMPLTMGASLWLGLILWIAMSGAAIFWCFYYERTEPL